MKAKDLKSVYEENPELKEVVPESVLARASYIQVQTEVYSLEFIRNCTIGSEVHCDFKIKSL